MKKISSSEIGRACEALKNSGIVDKDKGTYQKVFKGYISSFGASVAQAGLLPTIIFYENQSEQAKERTKVIIALKSLLEKEYQVESLAKHLLEAKKADDKNLLVEVSDAMVSMKLALRMFSEVKNN